MEKSLIPATVASATQAAGGVEDPLCVRPRNNAPRDDSPSGLQPYKHGRAREGIPSPRQQAQGEDHDIAFSSLGLPSFSLDLGQAQAAAQAATTKPRLNLGLDKEDKPRSSEQFAFACDWPRLHLFSRHCLLPCSSYAIANPSPPRTFPSLSCFYIASSSPYHAHPHD